MSQDQVRELEEELAGVARELARLLLGPVVDQARVDALDRRATVLRSRLRELQPVAAEPCILRSYLLCGG